MDDTAGLAVELELKLQVPPDRTDEVLDELRRLPGGVHHVRLAAQYLDTPEFELAAAGLAWRLRREDDQWVQTLKTRAAGTGFGRLEHNVPLGRVDDGDPSPDPSLHTCSPAGARLREVLTVLRGTVGVRHRTEIDRTVAQQRTDSGGVVELALDRGTIVAEGRRSAVCELEVELVEGSPADVIAAARWWVERHGLWLDSMHKARRGMLLARGVTTLPVQRSTNSDIAEIISTIRNNMSAVTNGMGGALHVAAVGHELQRVASMIDEPRAQQFAALGRTLVETAERADTTGDGLRAALVDRSVADAVLDLLSLLD